MVVDEYEWAERRGVQGKQGYYNANEGLRIFNCH
jgi:hypothetical protein